MTTFKMSVRSVRSARAPEPAYPASSIGFKILRLNALKCDMGGWPHCSQCAPRAPKPQWSILQSQPLREQK